MIWPFQPGSVRRKNRKQTKQHRANRKSARRLHRFEALEDRSLLAVFTVSNLDDAAVAPADSLRAALEAANAMPGADVIQFAAGLNGTIALAAGAGDLEITDSVTIQGPGLADITIDATLSASRVFSISDEAGDVLIRGLTLANGTAGIAEHGGALYSQTLGTLTIADSRITGSTAGAHGGGIYSQNDLVITGSIITGNTASGYGGGIYAGGNLTLTNVTVGGAGALGNTATGYGGGIYAIGNVQLTNSVISGNSTGTDGGGVYAVGTVNAVNSTIGGLTLADGNTAARDGGGVFARSVTLQNSTVSGNTANVDAGGVRGRTVVVRNSTVAGNEARDDAGGIFGSFSVTLQNATVANNRADSDGAGGGAGGGVYAANRFISQNSIIVGNDDTDGNPDLVPGAFNNIKFTLIGDNTGTGFAATGPAAPDPMTGNLIGMPGGALAIDAADVLDPAGLLDNGGPTPTIRLLFGSLAINRGSNKLVVNAALGDQRGAPFVRIFDTTVDMGAFEFQAPAPFNMPPTVANPIADQTAAIGAPYVVTFAPNVFVDPEGDPLTYSATLANGGALPAWLTFNAATRTFIGIPTAADAGSITVRVTASDGMGGTEFDDFVLTVAENQLPIVANPLSDQTAFQDAPFTFTFAADAFTDPDGDSLTYSATLTGGGALPAWLTFNPATRTFSGTPGAGDVGPISVRVRADDGRGGFVVDDFTLNVLASELPFTENFEGPVDPRVQEITPTFTVSPTNPINGAMSYRAVRNTVGSRPLAVVAFMNPNTPAEITNVQVNAAAEPGNGTTLWSNAVVIFDYQSPTDYKFAGVFQIIDKLIIGEVRNGVVRYAKQRNFTVAANEVVPLNVTIDRMTSTVTLASGATSVMHTYSSLGTGTVGIGTINANARFDNLVVS
jgi:predicted outer membrane repeat protein